ncbi:MAG: Fe-S protein assembly co-chaperone HscB [Proteobacteria bacterium]|nr:Fe-S protein assembly co-chaperone HscB [Pseudomonadota bacterium]
MINLNQDFFTLFGLSPIFTQNKATIKSRYYQLQKQVHPDNFVDATLIEKRQAAILSAMVNEAYSVLCSPLKRAIYLLKLHGVDIQAETDTQMPMDFLSHQMELREHLANKEAHIVKVQVEQALLDCEKRLSEILDIPVSSHTLMEARLLTRQMLFYVKLVQELNEPR